VREEEEMFEGDGDCASSCPRKNIYNEVMLKAGQRHVEKRREREGEFVLEYFLVQQEKSDLEF